MLELAITSLVMMQPSAEGVRAFEASAEIYRNTPALIDQMTYTVEMPVSVDNALDQYFEPGDEYIYWPN